MIKINIVTLYTDGAAKGNPGPGGYGLILEIKDENGNVISKDEYSSGFKITTNNRMELLAVIVGLEILTERSVVTVYSDSKYVTDAFNEGWIYNWIRNGWKTSVNKPVKNVDLWHRLIKIVKSHEVKFIWVKGHSNDENNIRCDELATQMALKMEMINKKT